MDGLDRRDNRTFRVNFGCDGAARLRDRVKEKLKEFMGDYTDDTLVGTLPWMNCCHREINPGPRVSEPGRVTVATKATTQTEYVVVLLRNGRHREEAERELNVFLGDDSSAFVSWLWDHLSSNLHLYMHAQETLPEVATTKSQLDKQVGRNQSQPEHLDGSFPSDSEQDKEISPKEYRSRRNREWKGLMRDIAEPPTLRSTEIDRLQLGEKIHRLPQHVQQSRSPKPVDRKRSRQEERQSTKREATSHPIIVAPRRLLQFAVRDAVGTPRSSRSRPEPPLKRLRSVVSTSVGDLPVDDQSLRTRLVGRNPVATAIKAAAEAAEDVMKFRSSGNVFDRLGCDLALSETTNRPRERICMQEGSEDDDFDQIPVVTRTEYAQRSECCGEFEGEATMVDRNTVVTSDSASDNDMFEDPGLVKRRVMDTFESASSGYKDENSLTVKYRLAKNVDEIGRKARMKDHQATAATASANASQKIVNISVNVNTWKPPHYQAPREITELDNRPAVQQIEAAVGKPGVQALKENNPAIPGNDNDLAQPDAPKEAQKVVQSTGSYSTVRPSEDADSRTVFVSNVHFAATKDSLSRHFNKFGDVLKVIIVTDAATGQPKGAAYIEFTRKEAAEHALTLNGTSFMSRILKVVKRASAQHEAALSMAWPRAIRGSPFGGRLTRASFTRGIPNAFRARLPLKTGARSLQWKRDAAPALTAATSDGGRSQQSGGTNPANVVPSPTGRNLTYVRTVSPRGNVTAM